MPYDIKRTAKCPAAKPYGLIRRADGSVKSCHVSFQKAGEAAKIVLAAEAKKKNVVVV